MFISNLFNKKKSLEIFQETIEEIKTYVKVTGKGMNQRIEIFDEQKYLLKLNEISKALSKIEIINKTQYMRHLKNNENNTTINSNNKNSLNHKNKLEIESDIEKRTNIIKNTLAKNLANPQDSEIVDIIKYFSHSKVFSDLYTHFRDNTDLLIKPFLKISINFLQCYTLNNHFIKSNFQIFQELILNLLPYTFEIHQTEITELIYEICKLFCKENKYYLLYQINKNTTSIKNNELYGINTMGELIYSCLINLLKNDHMHKNTEIKKQIRKSFLICFQYPEIYNSEFFNKSYFAEIIIERLCIYFEMMPNYFDIFEDKTLDIAYNIQQSFPLLLVEFLEFRDFIQFFSKLYDTIRSKALTEQIKTLFFNWFLLEEVQPHLLTQDIKEFRTNLQYLIFMMMKISSSELVFVIYFFVFGFPESLTNFKLKKSGFEGLKKLKEIENQYNKEFSHNYKKIHLIDNTNLIPTLKMKSFSQYTFFDKEGEIYKRANELSQSHRNSNITNSKINNQPSNSNNLNYNNKSDNFDLDLNKDSTLYKLINEKIELNTTIGANFNFGLKKNSTQNLSIDNSTKRSSINPPKEYDTSKFNYLIHDYIGISFAIISKMKLKTNFTDIVCLRFFELILEKFPFISIQRIILPFCESVVDKHKIISSKLNAKYPNDLSEFISFIEIVDGNKFSSQSIINYLNYDISNSVSIYIKNDIDFYLYYHSIREDKEQLNFIDQQILESEQLLRESLLEAMEGRKKKAYKNSLYANSNNNSNNNLNALNNFNHSNNRSTFSDLNSSKNNLLKVKGLGRNSTYNKENILSNYLLSKNKGGERNLYSNSYLCRVYDDEVEGVEDELNNIYIGVLKNIVEQFTSFFYNKSVKNVFLSNLILKLIQIPKLDFDPATTLFSSIILDETEYSPCSLLRTVKSHCKEAKQIMKDEPILMDFIKYTNIMNDNFNFPNEAYVVNKKTGEKELIHKQKPSLSLKYKQKFEQHKDTVNNIIILAEFIKQMFSILIHKQAFETSIQNLFGMYSDMLDENYFKDNYSIIDLENVDNNNPLSE